MTPRNAKAAHPPRKAARFEPTREPDDTTSAQSSDQLDRRPINHNEEQGNSTWPTIPIMAI